MTGFNPELLKQEPFLELLFFELRSTFTRIMEVSKEE